MSAKNEGQNNHKIIFRLDSYYTKNIISFQYVRLPNKPFKADILCVKN